MSKLPTYETFYTWQGEGCHMGRPAYFIRLFGCPIHCPWCDSAGTWHPDHIPAHIDKIEVEELANQATSHNPAIVVITGGEPCIHDLEPLTTALHKKGLKVHLETSGAFPIQGNFDWITVSPKIWKAPLEKNIRKADELKIIVDSDTAIPHWETAISHLWTTDSIWLNPEWSQHKNPEILKLINEAVKTSPHPYRAGYQLHKLYNVDLSDPHSKPNVPLGGKLNM